MKAFRVAVLLVLFCAGLAGAQSPLERPVTLKAQDITLQEALDRIAASARLRFTYSAETLQLTRRVSASYESLSVGEALADLLRAYAVSPVVVSANHIVLAPKSNEERILPPPVFPLEEMVVTGSATGINQKPLSFALTIIEGKDLDKQNVTTLAAAISAAIPGMWLWQASPSSMIAQYASIRGASSFGLSYPKIYIDGVEVANPLLLMQISPETVDRIEAIRGPQGAALYGADAISGVINIFTRSGIVGVEGRRISVNSTAGMAASAFTSSAVLAQDHTLSFATGSNVRSFGASFTAATLGEYAPGLHSKHFSANAQGRLIGARSSLTASLRFLSEEAGAADTIDSLVVQDSVRPMHQGDPRFTQAVLVDGPQTARQYTIGINGKLSTNQTWTHALIAGVDGYRLDNIANIATPVPSLLDSALFAARGGADRATLRFSSVANVGNEKATGLFTVAAEHSRLRQTVGDREQDVRWRSNTGLVGQFNAGLREQWFLTGGLRLERSTGFITSASQYDLLPMIGSAGVFNIGATVLKLRASYGKGIRPAQSATRSFAMSGHRSTVLQSALEPEQQSGTETGIDWMISDRFTLNATRFDQTASGLIQQVSVYTPPTGGPGGNSGPGGGGGANRRGTITHELQNVGEISNHGWELQAAFNARPFSLGGNVSLVDSRVEQLALGYGGDLQVGDRMLGVPRVTLGANASLNYRKWFGALTATRASDWIGYDRKALAEAFSDNTTSLRNLSGALLRNYWIDYDGATRLRAVVSRDVGRGLILSLTGENLLNHQTGEPDNVTLLPGRTVTVGLRARF